MALLKGKLARLTWHQLRDEVYQVNPVLAKLIDDLNPSDQYWLAKVSYPYGSLVMEKSLLMLPNDQGDIVPITDLSLDSTIREGLSYNLLSNPVSLVLKNTFEIFLPLEDRTIPLSGLIYPGTAFGAWRVLNPEHTQQPAFIWDMSAGARSVFMLPKITEVKKHLQLKRKYNLSADVPRSLMQHWEIFRQLANHPKNDSPWEAEIIYFPEQWFKHLDDNQWKPFYHYFYESAWGSSEFWRNQPIYNLIFSLILKSYEARPSAYIMDTVKYLLYIGMGSLPGLAPARNNLAGPFSQIQNIYQQDYELRNYPPIIMQPDLFSIKNLTCYPVYYSLQFPTASEFKPNSRIRNSIIADLHEIISLMLRYEKELLSKKFNIENISLSKIFRCITYNYFHQSIDLHQGMKSSKEMPQQDRSLLTTIDGVVHKDFPETSAFVKGCIRLTLKN